jgi:hypothetical protein
MGRYVSVSKAQPREAVTEDRDELRESERACPKRTGRACVAR